jgi:hypothetical protein
VIRLPRIRFRLVHLLVLFTILCVVCGVSVGLSEAWAQPANSGVASVIQAEASGRERQPSRGKISKLLGDGFILDLGNPSKIKTTPHRYVIRDLPPRCAVAVAFARRVDEHSEFELIPPRGALGIEEWSAEWKVPNEREAYSAEGGPKDTAFVVHDASDEKRWLTKEGAEYELTIRTRKSGPERNTEKTSESAPRLVLIGVPMDELVSKADTRPKVKRLVNHGRISKKDVRVSQFELKTPAGKYLVDLGEAAGGKSVAHRYELSGLPSGYALCIGFGLQSNDPVVRHAIERRGNGEGKETQRAMLGEFSEQSGVKRIHIHLATKDGHVLISEEFDANKALRGPALPIYFARPKGVNAFVGAPANNDWAFRPNTGGGSCFVAAEDATYVLEITIVDVEDSRTKEPVLRVLIRS